MAQVQIEIDDEKLELVGEIPPAVDTILKRIEADSKRVGYGEGVEKAAKDAKRQIEEAVAHEKAKLEARAPYEKERLQQLEADHKSLSEKLSEVTRETVRERKSLEEKHAEVLFDRTKKIEALNQRVQALTQASLRAYALEGGARSESLDELELILSHYIGYSDEMDPFVKGTDGQPMTAQGKTVSLSQFVKDYLEKHPHHRKPAPGRGGMPGQGRSLSTVDVPDESLDAAVSRINEGDRSAEAVDALFKATRKSATH